MSAESDVNATTLLAGAGFVATVVVVGVFGGDDEVVGVFGGDDEKDDWDVNVLQAAKSPTGATST